MTKKNSKPFKQEVDINYRRVADLIKDLQAIVDKYPNATIEMEPDYSGCYYEGDTPSYVAWVTE